MSATLVHSARRNVLEEEKTWSLTENHVVSSSASQTAQLSLADIAVMALEWSPSRADLSRFTCELKARNGIAFFIPSTHYRGFADFEDRAQTYALFVMAVAERVAIANPKCLLQSGANTSRYILNIIAFAVSAVLLVGVLFLVGPVWLGIAGLLAIIRLTTLPWALAWFWTNRPQSALLVDAVNSGILDRCLPDKGQG